MPQVVSPRGLRFLGASSVFLLLASCGGEGTNVPPDGRAGEQPDFIFPADHKDQGPGEEIVGPGDAAEDVRPGDEWETGDGDAPELDVPLDQPEMPTIECSKDSDCTGKPAPLAACMKLMCDKHQGVCVPGPRSPGEPCDDGDACTLDTACTAEGTCLGRTLVCDDGNLCSTDACDHEKGCVYTFNENVCDDGNSCTANDRCANGECAGEETAQCNCTKPEDCLPYDDGNLCDGEVKCVFGKCKVPAATIVHCDTAADTPCRKTVCDPVTGQCGQVDRDNGRPCDDGDACTVGDVCLDGKCIGSGPRSCDDHNQCTNDTCDSASGCLNEFTLYPCEDGDACTINDHCRLGQCVPGASNACSNDTCYPKWLLQCGQADVWSTAADGATSNVASTSCGGDPLPGPEYSYAFVAPYDGAVQAMISSVGPAMTLSVLEARGTGCDPTNCRAASVGVLSFEMFKGSTYYLVADGPGPEGQDYTVTVSCTPSQEILCADESDNDKDSTVDCEDPDCQGTPACPEPRCQPLWTLACGAADFGENYGLGSTVAVSSYADELANKGCLDNPWTYSGPEFAYRFDSPGSFNVTVTLSDETAQTDLLILQDNGQGCRPEDCVAWGLKKVTFPAVAGKTYYFVIDGYDAAQGSFGIDVTCPAFVETACGDGTDNDLDTLVDCDDQDCEASVECIGHCLPAKTVGCGFKEAFANFGWGSTDAVEEYDCTKYVYSGPETAYRFTAAFDTDVQATLGIETASTDLLVVEGQACDPQACLAHGLDSVTFAAEKGKTYQVIVDGWQDALGTYLFELACLPKTESICDDGTDNDGDGLTDCADVEDCSGSTDCPKCIALYPLACGDTDEWSNGGEESTDIVAAYGCTGNRYDGPEFAYTFAADTAEKVTVSLTSTGADLDLIVLADMGPACNPADCIGWGTDGYAFTAEAGNKYYFVVDGFGKAPPEFGPDFGSGQYKLTVTCEQP